MALSKFNWVDATTNVDGTPLLASEVTGFQIGVRPAAGTPGAYPMLTAVTNAAATSEAFTSLSTLLVPGSYAAAIQSVGPVNSAFSPEITFTIAAPIPAPPTGFSVS
jgi:hypothetical protein